MRNFLIASACALLLSACGQPQQQAQRTATQPNACARVTTHEVDFTQNPGNDVITARSEGPSCAQASVTFTVRADTGDLLWVFSNTYYDMTAGGTPPPDGAPAVTDAQMDEFLRGWANVRLQTSGDLPEWKASAASLAASVQGMSYNTEFSRDVYEAMRASNRPLLCYAAAAEAVQCLIVDPATNSPAVIAAYGP